MCTTCMAGALGSSEDSLELELGMVVHHYEGAGNRTQVLYKRSSLLGHLSSLYNSFAAIIVFSTEDCTQWLVCI